MEHFTELQPSPLMNHDNDDLNVDTYYNHTSFYLSQNGPLTSTPGIAIGNDGDVSQRNDLHAIVYELSHLPRDSFVPQLIHKCDMLNINIEKLRDDLFKLAQSQPNFPYPQATLKKRLNPRTKKGDTVITKLGIDCHVLYLASTGEYSDELKHTLKHHNLSIRNDCCDDSTVQKNNDKANIMLIESITRIESELNLLKGEYTQEVEFLNKALGDVQKENRILKENNEKQSEKSENLQIQLTMMRSKLDKYEQSQENLEKMKEAIIANVQEITDLKVNMKIIEDNANEALRSLGELKTEISKTQESVKKINWDVRDLDKRLKSESERLNRISDTKAAGVSNLKAKCDIMNNKVKELEETVNEMENVKGSMYTSLSDLRKRLNGYDRDIKALNKDYKSYAETLKSRDLTSPLKEINAQQQNPKSPKDVQVPQTNEEQNGCNETTPFVIELNDTLNVSRPTNRNDKSANHDKNNLTNTNDNEATVESGLPIDVHFPTSVCQRQRCDNFEGYKRTEKPRVARFYVAGINKKISSEAGMRKFLENNNVRVTHLRYFDKRTKRTASAQLNIDAKDEDRLRDPNFWPEGIFVREWLPWKAFINEQHD